MSWGSKTLVAIIGLAAAGAGLPRHAEAAAARVAPPTAAACKAMVGRTVAGSELTILKAETVPAGPAAIGQGPAPMSVALPAHCRIEGTIGAHTGADGKAYGLTVAIALPYDWNGRFLFQGGGGLNGALRPPLGTEGTGGRPALARGFAVVSTDGGHRGLVFDASFMADQQAALDFAFNAVPTVTASARPVVTAFYGRPIQRAYFAGCSTGGRESMQAAERYPALFDGIVTGAPAMRTGYSDLAMKWAAVAFNRVGTRDASGKLIPGSAFSADDRKLIIAGLLKACDELDGAKDGMIFNVRACRFDPAALACPGAKAATCLSGPQVEALRTAFSGPASPNGRRIYSGYPFDTGVGFAGPGIPGFLLNSSAGPLDGPEPPTSIDTEADEAKVRASATQQLIDTYNWTNLSGFTAKGGKQLFYHGVSDPWFSALDTVDYYERLGRDNGGADKVMDFARLFLVPGMGHCGGGEATLDQFDLLGALVAWVEEGKAPQSVVATGQSLPGRSRPLCPWPTHAHYKGEGDVNDAANFECRN